jgi:hypothetical protein
LEIFVSKKTLKSYLFVNSVTSFPHLPQELSHCLYTHLLLFPTFESNLTCFLFSKLFWKLETDQVRREFLGSHFGSTLSSPRLPFSKTQRGHSWKGEFHFMDGSTAVVEVRVKLTVEPALTLGLWPLYQGRVFKKESVKGRRSRHGILAQPTENPESMGTSFHSIGPVLCCEKWSHCPITRPPVEVSTVIATPC